MRAASCERAPKEFRGPGRDRPTFPLRSRPLPFRRTHSAALCIRRIQLIPWGARDAALVIFSVPFLLSSERLFTHAASAALCISQLTHFPMRGVCSVLSSAMHETRVELNELRSKNLSIQSIPEYVHVENLCICLSPADCRGIGIGETVATIRVRGGW